MPLREERMWKDKSPGVKILWVWTIGTAAVLVTNVARTRLRDMEKLVNAQDEQPAGVDSVVMDSSSADSNEAVGDHRS